VLGDKVVYLGCIASAEEAARAYDNAAFYAAQTERCRQRQLNFPEEYAQEPFPEPTERTRQVVADLESRVPNQRKSFAQSFAQIRHFPDRESVRPDVALRPRF
jgi:hypothetical protein